MGSIYGKFSVILLGVQKDSLKKGFLCKFSKGSLFKSAFQTKVKTERLLSNYVLRMVLERYEGVVENEAMFPLLLYNTFFDKEGKRTKECKGDEAGTMAGGRTIAVNPLSCCVCKIHADTNLM